MVYFILKRHFDMIKAHAVAYQKYAALGFFEFKGLCPVSYTHLDELSTFEEQYNAEYYQILLDSCGYKKEVDWIESKIYLPEDPESITAMEKMSDFVMKRYGLRIGEAKNVKDFLNRYGDGFFELLDVAYDGLYGTVPFTDGMKKMMMDNFRLIIDLKHVVVILNEENKIVCLGICFPSLAKALQKSNGHLTPCLLYTSKAWESRLPEVYEILRTGSLKAEAVAADTLAEVRHAMRIDLSLIHILPSFWRKIRQRCF